MRSRLPRTSTDADARGIGVWHCFTRDVAGKSRVRLAKLSKQVHRPTKEDNKAGIELLTRWEEDYRELNKLKGQALTELSKIEALKGMVPTVTMLSASSFGVVVSHPRFFYVVLLGLLFLSGGAAFLLLLWGGGFAPSFFDVVMLGLLFLSGGAAFLLLFLWVPFLLLPPLPPFLGGGAFSSSSF